MRSETGILFEPAHQARPTGQGEQFGLQNVLPVCVRNALGVQAIKNCFHGRKKMALLALEFGVQALQIFGEHAAATGEQRADSYIKTFLAIWHGPIGHALIEKHGAEADEPGMDDFVHESRLRRFFFGSHRAIETYIEEGPESGMAEILR